VLAAQAYSNATEVAWRDIVFIERLLQGRQSKVILQPGSPHTRLSNTISSPPYKIQASFDSGPANGGV